MMGWKVAGNGFYRFRINSCSPADDFQVVFVREIEEEDVVRLPIDTVFYGVWLICNECCEYPKMSHACDYVIPISFAKV